MSIYQRNSDNLWVVAWYVDGKKKTRAFKSETSARDFEGQRLAAVAEKDDRLTLGELAALFFRSHPDYHPKTKDTIIFFLAGREAKSGGHVEGVGEFLRDKYAENLNRRDLEMVREGFRARGAGNNTINKHQAYIRAILAWGVDQELIAFNPWRDFKRLPVRRKEFSTTLSDIRAVVKTAPEWLRWAMATTYALSLRPGMVELFSLMWTAFDFRLGIVRVRQGKSGRFKTVYPPRPYMEEEYRRFLEDMAAGVPLVCHRAGKRVLAYNKAWGKALKDANVPHFPMYDIRHVSVSEMLANGGDLAAVSAQAGHANVSTTGTFYAHVTPGGQQRAAALMPGIEDAE